MKIRTLVMSRKKTQDYQSRGAEVEIEIGPGDTYRDAVHAVALGAFGEDIGNLVQIKADAAMPDTAGKNDPEDLFRIARVLKKSLRPAGPSRGKIILETSTDASVGIPLNAHTEYALSRAIPIDSNAAPSGRRNASSCPAASHTEMLTGTPISCDFA